jgi:predicted flap endonuclease-1-like 5' DNA nuclease
MNIPCILIPVLVGLICGILGYLLGKMNAKGDDSLAVSLQADLDACKANTRNLNAKISSLEDDLASKNNISTTNISTSGQSFTSTIPPAFLFDAELVSTVYGKKIKENDLKIVEGIGPKIEALLNAAGITTWHALSETSTEKLQSILDAGGENYAIHNPSTWAKQAFLAYQGKWQELKDWQQGLLGGKE